MFSTGQAIRDHYAKGEADALQAIALARESGEVTLPLVEAARLNRGDADVRAWIGLSHYARGDFKLLVPRGESSAD